MIQWWWLTDHARSYTQEDSRKEGNPLLLLYRKVIEASISFQVVVVRGGGNPFGRTRTRNNLASVLFLPFVLAKYVQECVCYLFFVHESIANNCGLWSLWRRIAATDIASNSRMTWIDEVSCKWCFLALTRPVETRTDEPQRRSSIILGAFLTDSFSGNWLSLATLHKPFTPTPSGWSVGRSEKKWRK